MQIGFIGLGKMGLEMSTRAIRGGHELVGFDNSTVSQEKAKEREIPVAASVEELVKTLEKPRVVWMQLPPGEITNQMIHTIGEALEPGDMLIDGGNTDFR